MEHGAEKANNAPPRLRCPCGYGANSLWIGNLLGAQALAAVAISRVIIVTAMSFVIGMNNAALAILSQRCGRNDPEAEHATARRAPEMTRWAPEGAEVAGRHRKAPIDAEEPTAAQGRA